MCIYYIYNMNTEVRDTGMEIIIRNTGDTPIYEQIVTQIKNAIVTGDLQEGEALPSMRLLAKELRISLITTKRAYEELEREGFIVTMTGRGSFVAAKNLELLREEQRKQVEQCLTEAIAHARPAGITREELCTLIQMLYEED